MEADCAFEPRTEPKDWTPQEEARLIRLKEVEGKTWDQIVRRFPGRTRAGIISKYAYMKSEKTRAETPPAVPFVREPIPDHVLLDAARRAAAGPRDLVGAIMGDPPRGHSALDRRTA